MKTIAFADSHLVEIQAALVNRIHELEQILAGLSPDHSDRMFYQDKLDISRQALALVEG